MGQSLEQRRAAAEIRRQIAENQLAAKKYQLQYEALERGGRSRRKRPEPPRERNPEDRGLVAETNRLRAIAMARDLVRKSPLARALVTTLAREVVGTGATAKWMLEDREQSQQYGKWFNVRWARRENADRRGIYSWGELQRIILCEVVIAGEVLVHHDPETNSLTIFDAEMLTNINAKQADLREGHQQIDGIIVDPIGRPVSYVVSPKREMTEVKPEDATVLPADECTLVMMPDRYQHHGVSHLLSILGLQYDIQHMLDNEIQAGKVASAFAMVVKRNDALEVGLGRSEEDDQDPDQETQHTNLERMGESFGATEYLEPGEDVQVIKNDRPGPQIKEFSSFVATLSGSALGLPASRSLLRTDNSFSAARDELNTAAATYEVWQEMLEGRLLDWVMRKVVSRAVSTNRLPDVPDWDIDVRWQHKQQEPIDRDKKVRSQIAELQAGTKTLSDIDPDWQETIRQRAREQRFAEDEEVYLPWLYEADPGNVAGLNALGDEDADEDDQ